VSTPTSYQKPLPVRTAENGPYWDSAKRHGLQLQQCRGCERFRYPPAKFCPRCLSDETDWREISGRGTVYSFIVVHQRYDPSFAEDLPYNVAIVELEEGPRLTTNVVDCANGDLQVGMAVELTYDDVTEEFTLPKFRPATG
jgi:uncharacterized OB-fold protein